MASPKQVTLLVPGVINMANGEGAAQARKDMGVGEGDETSFCTAGKNGHELTNSGAEVVNNQSVATNEPGRSAATCRRSRRMWCPRPARAATRTASTGRSCSRTAARIPVDHPAETA